MNDIFFEEERNKRNEALEQFWEQFKQYKVVANKVQLVKRMAGLRFYVGGRFREKRERFDRNKAKYYRAEGKCMICGKEAFVRHHVIQLKHGGNNSGRNLMRLCFA